MTSQCKRCYGETYVVSVAVIPPYDFQLDPHASSQQCTGGTVRQLLERKQCRRVRFLQTLRGRARFTSLYVALRRTLVPYVVEESVQQCCACLGSSRCVAWTTVSGWRWARKHVVVCHRSPPRWSGSRNEWFLTGGWQLR